MEDLSQRRLAAILAADIVGYTRLMGEDQQGTLAALRQLRLELFEPAVTKHNGNVVKRLGDGWIVEFPSVSDAIGCSQYIQSELTEHETIRLRMGVHSGDVVFEDEDVFGDGVNVAARLEQMAEPGEVLVSDTAHSSLDGKTAAKFFSDGPQQLKNVARDVTVWRWPRSRPLVPSSSESEIPELPSKPSIAVLPFDNLSRDEEQEYFADGITEDVITGLSKYQSFFVIARNTSFTFKGRSTDVKAVAAQLGVHYILEGSVRKSGDRLRITAQLIEGVNGNSIWAEKFDRRLEDIFDVQDEITQTIVGVIGPEIGNHERMRAAQQRPGNLGAWGVMQQGLHQLWRLDDASLEKSIGLFQRALEMDPNLAQLHSYLSFALEQMSHSGKGDEDKDSMDAAWRHATRAIELDQNDSLSHAVLARVFGNSGRYDDAIFEAKTAIELNPNDGMAFHVLAAIYFWADRCEESIEASTQAIRLSPKDPFMPLVLAIRGHMVLRSGGEVSAALADVGRAVRLPNADYRTWYLYALVCQDAGNLEDAKRGVEMVMKLRPNFTMKRIRERSYPGITDSLGDDMAKTWESIGSF